MTVMLFIYQVNFSKINQSKLVDFISFKRDVSKIGCVADDLTFG